MNLALQLCPPLVGVPQLLLQPEVGILLRTRCSRPHLGVSGDHQTVGDDGNGSGNGPQLGLVLVRQLVMMAMAMAMVIGD